ncbi:DUF6171 family protein [Robertmurraya korlensis]|uniref:DUF6171 family protein n=1 Tax=Robertmurraya korlensis TaxID=519977 RepID=UPI00203F808E|nr:DUF6171 family protein [Robertmurraya korlensis]MCM3601850.1 DUF6171 family protein [Robertmurraya korlensis]
MSEKSLCKGCVESVIVSEEVIEELILEAEEQASLIVSEEVYKERLQICEECPSLKYESTCAYSGCIVRYRAKFKNKGCPYAGKPKWEKVS